MISNQHDKANNLHSFVGQIHLAFVPGATTPLLKEVVENLMQVARDWEHEIQEAPNDQTDVILTTAPFGESLDWREALSLSSRRRFHLRRTPVIYTLVHVPTVQFRDLIDHFETALEKTGPDLDDFDFPGLAPKAYEVLFEQGRRAGPVLALGRVVQAQAKSIHTILIVGDENPLAAYHFDLVGAHPRSDADNLSAFYTDILLRLVTSICSKEVTEHQVVDESIPYSVWQQLSTPTSMQNAASEFGKRDFFTEMVRIQDLVAVPAVGDVVAEQYSEGCFATWEPALGALVATVTGSARPLNKDNITESDLCVIVGVRGDGKGAKVRHVDRKENLPPSSESVEMMLLDSTLPQVTLPASWGLDGPVPVIRSKLHGHRGIGAYDPAYVEFVPLAAPFYDYLVSCATDAQAQGVQAAFAQAVALQEPDDPREVAFTVLPGHGIVVVEKWVEGKDAFQVLWEYMDSGYLHVNNAIPQGPMQYVKGADGQMHLETENQRTKPAQ